MKNLLRYLAFVLIVGSACAQSNLPACEGQEVIKWNNCFGSWTAPNGDKYVGEWKSGKRTGKGTYYFFSDNQFNGDKYSGDFKNNVFNGQGSYYYFANVHGVYKGNIYVGEWKDDKRTGLGTYFYLAETSSKGDKFIGEYKDNKRSGHGAFIRADGRVAIGEWSENQPHGRLIEYRADKSIERTGIWENGKFLREESVNPTLFARISSELTRPNVLVQNTETSLRLNQNTTDQPSDPLVSPFTVRRIALVIGNANYRTRPLRNPRNDADDISNALKATGFQVIDLRDSTLQQMRNAVRQFGDRLINNDVGLVYYSGHGVEVKGRNYFIPVNADIMREDEISDQGLDVSLILEKMNTAGKGVNILIVDACRDDPFGRSFRSSSRGLAQMDAPRGTIIAYATSPGKVASDGDPRERNSPYTKNLVKAMQQPNKPIEQVFKEVRRAVQEETKNQQTPWENTSLSGDFYFKVQR